MIEILANEDKDVLPVSFWLGPFLIRNVTVEEHANALENELGINTFDGQDSFVTVEVGT